MCEKHTYEYRCNRRKTVETAEGYEVCKKMLESTADVPNPDTGAPSRCWKVSEREMESPGLNYTPYCTGKDLVWKDPTHIIAHRSVNASWCTTCQQEDQEPANKSARQQHLDAEAKRLVEGQQKLNARNARIAQEGGGLRSPSELESSDEE